MGAGGGDTAIWSADQTDAPAPPGLCPTPTQAERLVPPLSTSDLTPDKAWPVPARTPRPPGTSVWSSPATRPGFIVSTALGA